MITQSQCSTKTQAADIFDQASRSSSTADEVEVLFYGGHSALTRFANNTIHQNVAEENCRISVRTVFGGRTARATTNKFDDESLKRVVNLRRAWPRYNSLIRICCRCPTAEGAKPTVACAHPDILIKPPRLTPELRAEAVKQIVSVAEKHKLTTAGIFSNCETFEGIFNSRGLVAVAYADLF